MPLDSALALSWVGVGLHFVEAGLVNERRNLSRDLTGLTRATSARRRGPLSLSSRRS